MIGAMIGDLVGSVYEFRNIKTKDFPLQNPGADITDDSLMTCAVAKALQESRDTGADFSSAVIDSMRHIGTLYPDPMGAYGGRFRLWLTTDMGPYNSFGNGSAMRVSPCGEAAETLEEALQLAELSAAVTHNHPEGIKGARATAAAVFLAKSGKSKAEIREYIVDNFYPMEQTLDEIRPFYRFDGSCQGTVPQALQAFFESVSFEDALRNAISLGGDSDTLADITCAVAWAYYKRQGMTDSMALLRNEVLAHLPVTLKNFALQWEEKYGL